MSTKPIKLREARKMLHQAGFIRIRTSGKHEVWRHSDSRSLSLPFTPTGDGLRGSLAQKVRAFTKEAQ